VPAIKLSGSTRKSAPKSAPKRKPAAKQAPTRSRKPAAKSTPKRKPAPEQTAAPTNGGTRGPKLPEGWTKRDFEKAVKDMRKAKEAREAASAKLAEAQTTANDMALELLQEGVQMSVISTELDLSRQWLYTLMEKNGITPARARSAKPAARTRSASTGRTSKPAAKKRPAAKSAPKSKPAAKRSAPARKRPASKPAGRVRLAR
jgi:hypothetical protein